MKKYFNITIGGLQQKIFNLCVLTIIALILAYTTVAVYLVRDLSGLTKDTSKMQKENITGISSQTMDAVAKSSLEMNVKLESYIADDIFSELKTNVLMLSEAAYHVYTLQENYSGHPVEEPVKERDGETVVQVIYEEGIDKTDGVVAETVRLLGNLESILYGIYDCADNLSSCFIASPKGLVLIADNRSGAKFDEEGRVLTLPVRQRPWYTGAVEAGDVYYTGVELDAFTGKYGIVCSAPVYVDGELVAVVGADLFLDNMEAAIRQISSEEKGIACVVDAYGKVIFSGKNEGVFKVEDSAHAGDLRENENEELAAYIKKALAGEEQVEIVNIGDKAYYIGCSPVQSVGWTLLTIIDKEMLDQPTALMTKEYDLINRAALRKIKNNSRNSLRTIVILVSIILIGGIISSLIFGKRVVKPLELITKEVSEINGYTHDFRMDDAYRTGDEIEVLAEAFKKLTERSQRYIKQITNITAEKERISTELSLATKIQADMLPNIFPAFPDREEFDIYASMTPAKEVGGDFYDFFLIDEEHLALVIADVSGKGVPAALFMMVSKILIANFTMLGYSPKEILEKTNTQICMSNGEDMFVTVWLGIMEIATGRVVAANAGHEYPAIKQTNGSFELLKDKHGFVIGGMEGVRYTEYDFVLEKGATLFVYTDGVPEATNADNELFGTDRMLEALNKHKDVSPQEILNGVKRSVDVFVGTAPQFDDLTMLSVKML